MIHLVRVSDLVGRLYLTADDDAGGAVAAVGGDAVSQVSKVSSRDYYLAHHIEIKRARLRNRSQSRARSNAIDGIHDRDRLCSGILLKCLNRSGYQSIAFGIIIMIMFVIAIDYADYMSVNRWLRLHLPSTTHNSHICDPSLQL